LVNLDIGCGANPKGNVNVDLFITKYAKRNTNLRLMKIPNLIKADIHFLPFKDKTFNYSFCYHVLEHIEVKFIPALKELIRVTKHILEIELPHRFDGYLKYHNKYFGVLSLKALLHSLNLGFTFDLKQRCFPHNYLCLLRIPHRMRIRISC